MPEITYTIEAEFSDAVGGISSMAQAQEALNQRLAQGQVAAAGTSRELLRTGAAAGKAAQGPRNMADEIERAGRSGNRVRNIAIGFAAVAAASIIAYKTLPGFRNMVDQVADRLKKAGQDAAGKFKGGMDLAGKAVQQAGTHTTNFLGSLKQLPGWLVTNAKGLRELATGAHLVARAYRLIKPAAADAQGARVGGSGIAGLLQGRGGKGSGMAGLAGGAMFAGMTGMIAPIASLAAAIAALNTTLGSGVRLNKSYEDSALGIAAVFRAFDGGKFKTFDQAFVGGEAMVERIRKKAMETSATVRDLVAGYTGSVGMMFSAGITRPDQQLELTSAVANATKAFGLRDPYQMQQESRALLTGDFGPDSTLGRSLFNSDQERERYRELLKQGKAYDMIMGKLAAFQEGGKAYGKTMSGAIDRIRDSWDNMRATVTAPLFDYLKTQAVAFSKVAEGMTVQVGKFMSMVEGNIKAGTLGELIELELKQGFREGANQGLKITAGLVSALAEGIGQLTAGLMEGGLEAAALSFGAVFLKVFDSPLKSFRDGMEWIGEQFRFAMDTTAALFGTAIEFAVGQTIGRLPQKAKNMMGLGLFQPRTLQEVAAEKAEQLQPPRSYEQIAKDNEGQPLQLLGATAEEIAKAAGDAFQRMLESGVYNKDALIAAYEKGANGAGNLIGRNAADDARLAQLTGKAGPAAPSLNDGSTPGGIPGGGNGGMGALFELFTAGNAGDRLARIGGFVDSQSSSGGGPTKNIETMFRQMLSNGIDINKVKSPVETKGSMSSSFA